MKNPTEAIHDYLESVPIERKEAFTQLYETINNNIPKGFQETISYGMIGWVVPHSIYPSGYHCSPDLPLPFISIANQKNFIALYHMGIYGDKNLLEWFSAEYSNHAKYKLDMGKSCIRFKKTDDIPYALIGNLVKKLNVHDWIALYEDKMKR